VIYVKPERVNCVFVIIMQFGGMKITTDSFNDGPFSGSTRPSWHRISQKYTPPTVYAFIVAAKLFTTY